MVIYIGGTDGSTDTDSTVRNEQKEGSGEFSRIKKGKSIWFQDETGIRVL